MKTSKSFNQEYIEKAKTLIHEILEDKKEYDDWTQICFSMQNAVQAAANIWGISSDEQINKMRAFITEMVLIELSNLKQFDIVFKKKGIRSLDTLYCPKCGSNNVEEEETALTEELEAVFDMGEKGFVATEEIIQQVMDLRECDEDEAKRFVALGVHLGCTFGDLNDTFEECSYGEQLYCANGIDYYIGTEDELTNIASDRVHNDDEYAYLWREAVAAQRTTDSLSDWLNSIISEDGWCSVLNSWDGRYEEYKIAEEYICVCRS